MADGDLPEIEGPDPREWPHDLTGIGGLMRDLRAVRDLRELMSGTSPVEQPRQFRVALDFLGQTERQLKLQAALWLLGSYGIDVPEEEPPEDGGEGRARPDIVTMPAPFAGAGRARAFGQAARPAGQEPPSTAETPR